MEDILLYHGSGEIVEFPEIRKTKYTKDFSWGFYCTKIMNKPINGQIKEVKMDLLMFINIARTKS